LGGKSKGFFDKMNSCNS